MKYTVCVELGNNVNELKRIATAYVEDSRRLDIGELKLSLLKTEEQYTSYTNIARQIEKLKLNDNPIVRIIAPIFLRNCLLDADDYMMRCKSTEEAVLAYEKATIDDSNNFDVKHLSKDFALFKFVLDKAWEHGDNISVDEKNLIEAIRNYLHITYDEQNMLEAKAGRYPTKGNALHTRSDIELVRKALQSAGLLFYIKDSEGFACDIIPEEIARQIRAYYGIELKRYGYIQLIQYVTKITKKQYLLDIIEKFNELPDTARIDLPQSPTIGVLQATIIKSIKPSNLLGGFSPRDGLDAAVLQKWCADLKLAVSGVKSVLIERLLNYYDGLREIEISGDDDREKYYKVYHELAYRDLKALREQEIIGKDLECERLFERATEYLFEIKLKNKPLNLTGTEHPDGKLSYNDKYIMWDNKSKESPVNLRDHIAQFDRYIKNSDKHVAVFMVIAPEFTENSEKECAKYVLNSDTQILLITADELKSVAESWAKSHPEEIFNLGYFKQNGRFDSTLLG